MGNKGAANRCKWVNLKNPAYIRYHDTEWGVPQHKDEVLFEMLFLEWFQAGLSWECILNKREGFRRASTASTRKKSADTKTESSPGCWPTPALSATG